MKVKFPQYKVTLAVSSHGAMHIEEYRTTAVRSIASAKHLFNENRHLLERGLGSGQGHFC